MACKNSTTRQGVIRLDGVNFSVVDWDPSPCAGKKLTSIWVRLRGFPATLWDWIEFDKLFNPFGAVVLELDPATKNKYDWHFARIRLGVCNPKILTEQHWILYRNTSGFVSDFDLEIEVENEFTESVNAWRGRTKGKGDPKNGPNKVLGRGVPPNPSSVNGKGDQGMLLAQ